MVRTHLKIPNLQGLKSILLRQPETWDPLLQCLHLDTPLFEQWNIKNCMGPKMHACAVGENSRPQRYKEIKQSNCHLWRAWSKNWVLEKKSGYCSCPLETTHLKGWADHLSYPSSLTPGHSSILTPYKEQVVPSWGVSEQGNLTCWLFSPSSAAVEAPIKPCLNFLSGLWSISIDWGRPKTLYLKVFSVPWNHTFIINSCQRCFLLPVLSFFDVLILSSASPFWVSLVSSLGLSVHWSRSFSQFVMGYRNQHLFSTC